MAKILRWMPELVILLKGVGSAARSVFFTLVLLVLVVYVFALTFRQLTSESTTSESRIGDLYFPTVASAMASLLFRAVLPDVADLMYEFSAESYLYGFVMLMFVLAATLTVMNMLVGILVEVVANVSSVENEQLVVNMVRKKMYEMISSHGLDADGNGMISRDEFEALIICPSAAQFIEDVGVDVVGVVDCMDIIFRDRELEFHEFVDMILQLRGNNQSKVKDIVDMRKVFMTEIEKISSLLELQHSLGTRDQAKEAQPIIPAEINRLVAKRKTLQHRRSVS